MTYSSEGVFYYRDTNGNIVKGDSELFSKMTGAYLCNEMIVTQNAKKIILGIEYPEHMTEAFRKFVRSYESKYCDYLRDPPQLYIGKIPGAEYAGFNLWTNQDIEKGQVVVEYLGKLKTLSEMGESSFEYAINFIDHSLVLDASEFRNCAAMINDGFPNCIGVELREVAGLNMRFILVASEKIKAGDTLFWDYGSSHLIKEGSYHIFRDKILEEFFTHHPLKRIFEKLLRLSHYENVEEILEYAFIGSKIKYLFNTPAAILHLILKKIIEPNEVLELLQKEEFLQFWTSKRGPRNRLLERVREFVRFKNKSPPESLKKLEGRLDRQPIVAVWEYIQMKGV